jgi:hypothetical protein
MTKAYVLTGHVGSKAIGSVGRNSVKMATTKRVPRSSVNDADQLSALNEGVGKYLDCEVRVTRSVDGPFENEALLRLLNETIELQASAPWRRESPVG